MNSNEAVRNIFSMGNHCNLLCYEVDDVVIVRKIAERGSASTAFFSAYNAMPSIGSGKNHTTSVLKLTHI